MYEFLHEMVETNGFFFFAEFLKRSLIIEVVRERENVREEVRTQQVFVT